MENLISLVNKIQRACTALGDHGEATALPTLWDSLPSIAVVGGQSSGKSSVLESVVGKDFLPRGSGIVTRRPLVLQLHKIDEGSREYAEFLHLPRKRFTDFAAVRREIQDETDRETGRTRQISSVPIHLSIYSPNVVNLTLIDLPGLTKVAVEGQPDSIVQDIENMVRSYIEKPNCIILAISPANQDLATSDAIKISREVDPTGERTLGVLTKIDLMDRGTDAVDILEGKSYRLKFPWVGVVNRSQADINKNVDMIAARHREREYFANTPEYKHLAHRMGSEHLAKMLSKHLEVVIKSKIPGIQSLVNKTIAELESELSRLGKPIAADAGGKMYSIMEICRLFDQIYKEHLDGIACTALGDHGEATALPTLWDSLPSIAVVGGQSSGKSSVLESVVGKDFLPRGSGIVTRRPLVLQLHKIDEGSREYAEFLHLPRKRFTDFAAVRREIQDETDRETGRTRQISSVPIHLSIYSPNVVNLTLIDLPGLTKVAVEGQPDSIVQDIENMVRSYIEKPNCIILAISPANQDLATSDAIKISREVDPTGERTLGVLTKIDLMDRGTDAVDILEGKSYRLKFPWVGVVNRSQADINKNVDMIAARHREREYFANTPEYKHLAHRMGSEHLAKMLSKHLEVVIKSKIPGIQSLVNKTIAELESELSRLGKPIAADAGGKMYSIMEICRLFDQIYKEHLDGIRSGGDKIYNVFDNQLPAALKRLQFDKQLSMENIRKLITEADGYQPHLIAPEQGYRRLIESSVVSIRGPAEAAVDAVHALLKDLVHKAISETIELKQYPALRVEVSNAAIDYLTVDFFRKLPQDVDKGGNPTHSIFDRYNDSYLRRIGSTVLSYVNMVCASLRNSIPKSIVYCQVREAKRSLLDHFFIELGKLEQKQLSSLLNEDPAIMERRAALAKRLELYRSAQAEIDAAAWSK
ncbi:hypothetical protein SADUNF_Sadunf03G0106500 [Salix dunnii]|uniref:Uncharacterized protein n=1 Tax=Salix dunnii TaxID=1413687 RepID=A0A835KCH3_9ROSI|nr:hypothetical protein SADUNF_Sadunf03G0106500 [Salix dunnii]